MRMLVTGGLGFVGRRLCDQLAGRGHEITVLDNASRASEVGKLSANMELVAGDIRDEHLVRNACRGMDVVVHLAAIQGTQQFYRIPEHVLDVNLRGVLNVAQACATEGVRRLFFSSSSEVYGIPTVFPTHEDTPLVVPDIVNPRWSYCASKIAGELVAANYARRCGFEYTIVRFHNVYGPAMGWDHVIPQFICRLEQGEEFTVEGDGNQRRSFCYIDDAVDCTVSALEAEAAVGQVFNIGNPSAEVTITELIGILSRVSGKPIEPRYLPFGGEGTRRRLPDITRSQELLRFTPRVGLEEGLRRTYEWYVDKLQASPQEQLK